jgi:hypothetical protein
VFGLCNCGRRNHFITVTFDMEEVPLLYVGECSTVSKQPFRREVCV